MKSIIVTILLGILSGCGHDNNQAQINPVSMSGTWRFIQVHDFYNVDTDEYLFTEYSESSLIINEESDEIRYYECWEYGSDGHLGIKTDNHFYINYGNTAFHLNNDGSYSTDTEDNLQYIWSPEMYFNRHYKLEKISSDTLIDKGLLVLSGPVEVTEYNHVCLWKLYSNLFEERTLELQVPYDDMWLGLRIDLTSTPEIGEVSYTRFEEGAAIYGFNISSNASHFWQTVGSNILDIDTANINIIESSNVVLSGTYSFIANNNEDYSGEFSIDLGD
ncbi:MAG: hypothetical protein KZQ93_00125 [Candidatus Thiodiazotropha sp. (ex Monitilora ramsayi)]|nr:hypothetical protein [Candidatus Thiodiazotropha sp. (ex Monitilora ramsayi)]